jgi:hypothetical protein
MRYFFVTFLTPIGPGAEFFRSELHPLHPEAMSKITAKVARGVTKATGGQLCPQGAIFIQGAQELEPEVAVARFPKDFEGQGTPETAGDDPHRPGGWRTPEVPDT